VASTHARWVPPPGLRQQATLLKPRPLHAAVQGHWLQPAAAAYAEQLPFAHTSSLAHTVRQPPQFSGSVFWFTHAVRPLAWHASGVGFWQPPPPPVATHAPAWQACPAVQPAPQVAVAEQNAGSDFRSTQLPPHRVRPVRHAHTPEVHASVSAHACPQVPQFVGSLVRSRQRLPPPPPPGHWERPVPQLQAPAVQVPAPQEVPHCPQFAALVCRSTHWLPPQVALPAPQPHTPFVQVLPFVQLASARHATQVLVVRAAQ
jgi:hypothetical protein